MLRGMGMTLLFKQQVLPATPYFLSLHSVSETYFFDVDKLADIHVIISVLDIRPYCLNYLTDHRYNDIPP